MPAASKIVTLADLRKRSEEEERTSSVSSVLQVAQQQAQVIEKTTETVDQVSQNLRTLSDKMEQACRDADIFLERNRVEAEIRHQEAVEREREAVEREREAAERRKEAVQLDLEEATRRRQLEEWRRAEAERQREAAQEALEAAAVVEYPGERDPLLGRAEGLPNPEPRNYRLVALITMFMTGVFYSLNRGRTLLGSGVARLRVTRIGKRPRILLMTAAMLGITAAAFCYARGRRT